MSNLTFNLSNISVQSYQNGFEEVVKLNPWFLIGMFIMYIILHISIGLLLKESIKDLEKNPNDKELISTNKTLKIWFKVFPMVYLIIVLIMLYT